MCFRSVTMESLTLSEPESKPGYSCDKLSGSVFRYSHREGQDSMMVMSIRRVLQVRGAREMVLSLLVVLMTQDANAQFVRVGPVGGVRVRTPFVAVDVLPFGGGARVRAPFTSVETGFYRSYRYAPAPFVMGVAPVLVPYPYGTIAVPAYPRFVYPQPYPSNYPELVYPRTDIRSRMMEPDGFYRSARSAVAAPLPERLRRAAERLAKTLSLREDGDVWLNYLGPQRIIENVDYSWPSEAVQDLIINYDGVVANGRLGSIQHARGFAETRSLLRQYLTPETTPSTSPSALVAPRHLSPAPSTPIQAPNPQAPIPKRSVPQPPSAKPPQIQPSTNSSRQHPSNKGNVSGSDPDVIEQSL